MAVARGLAPDGEAVLLHDHREGLLSTEAPLPASC